MKFEIDDTLLNDAVTSICFNAFNENYYNNNKNAIGLDIIKKQVYEYIKTIDATEIIREHVQKQIGAVTADVVADLLRAEIKRQAAALKKQGGLM